MSHTRNWCVEMSRLVKAHEVERRWKQVKSVWTVRFHVGDVRCWTYLCVEMLNLFVCWTYLPFVCWTYLRSTNLFVCRTLWLKWLCVCWNISKCWNLTYVLKFWNYCSSAKTWHVYVLKCWNTCADICMCVFRCCNIHAEMWYILI